MKSLFIASDSMLQINFQEFPFLLHFVAVEKSIDYYLMRYSNSSSLSNTNMCKLDFMHTDIFNQSILSEQLKDRSNLKDPAVY